jgi:hypothetical protein
MLDAVEENFARVSIHAPAWGATKNETTM